jgi:S1-C subfamily serine protease
MKRAIVLAALFFALVQHSALVAGDQKPLPWLGMGVRPFTSGTGQRLLHVERTTPAGPSERAGIRPGDIITTVGGTSLRFDDDLAFLLFIGERKPGERLRFSIVRAGSSQTITVTIGVMPETSRGAWEQGLRTARQKRIAAQRRAQ